MKEEDYSRAIEVFSGSPWEAEIIKGLLESNDIRCVIKDGIMGTLAPYIAPSVSVLVTEDPVSYTHLTLPTICSV